MTICHPINLINISQSQYVYIYISLSLSPCIANTFWNSIRIMHQHVYHNIWVCLKVGTSAILWYFFLNILGLSENSVAPNPLGSHHFPIIFPTNMATYGGYHFLSHTLFSLLVGSSHLLQDPWFIIHTHMCIYSVRSVCIYICMYICMYNSYMYNVVPPSHKLVYKPH